VVSIDPCAFEPVLTDQPRTFSRLHDTRNVRRLHAIRYLQLLSESGPWWWSYEAFCV
jgi:hypothetical protein